VTSDRLTDFLENRLHLRHRRYKRGYRNVINEARRLTDGGTMAPLAIETSGHGAVRDNYYLDDGAYLAVRLLIAGAKLAAAKETLGKLIADFIPPFEAREYRISIRALDAPAAARDILSAFERRCAAVGLSIDPNSCEGVRASDRRGWMLLRMSLHEPVLPLNIEGNEPGDCDALSDIAKAFFAGIDSVDPSVFD
jgi:phosphomannomutase